MSEPKRFKRYIVFIIAQYYPAGGLGDISGSFDDIEEARAHGRKQSYGEDWHVVDRDTWETM